MAKNGSGSGGPSLNVAVSLLIIIIAGVLAGPQAFTGAPGPAGNGAPANRAPAGSGAVTRPVGASSGSTPAATPTSAPAPSSSRTASPAATPAPVPPTGLPAAIPAITKASALAQLDALTVATPATEAYARSKFKHWTDADANGCNTRAEVLLAETTQATTRSSTCVILTGSWYSPYDNTTITKAGSLDVDHMVPLKEAWISGANTWTPAQREAYANDLANPGSLIAVSATTNRSKSDQDPNAWMPPNTAYRCTYVATWIAVKARWHLSVDTAERSMLLQTLGACPANAITAPTH